MSKLDKRIKRMSEKEFEEYTKRVDKFFGNSKTKNNKKENKEDEE